ncbi:Lon protease family protein [Photobacterium rosenbergii]|uniref:endopeptidase La n=1 Tax=Photobacterium rosenbergii TaxID=294936 RepID=A0ABU3ZKK8_9GAMM|nr:AAA family ATPase [Photobacterium rosenbergii]MDV5170543.1 AAA family ATPase [Photobacterium rosenbergii]
MNDLYSKFNLQRKTLSSACYSAHPDQVTAATRLEAAKLFHPCDPALLDFDTTEDIAAESSPLGLERAIEALKVGIGIPSKGFNIFVMGSAGLGKHTMTKQLLAQHADLKSKLSDWCYVNNFSNGNKPVALQLPAGMGIRLKESLWHLIEELKKTVPTLLQNEDFISNVDKLQNELNDKEIAAFRAIEKRAKTKSCILKRSSNGYVIHPVKEGKIFSKEEFEKLPKEKQQAIDQSINELRRMLVNLLKQVPLWDQEMRQKKDQLERESIASTLDYLISQLPEDLMAIDCIVSHTENLKQHVLNNIPLFNGSLETEVNEYTGQKLSFSPYTIYDVNLLIDNSRLERPPIIYEDNPTYANLIGRIEHKGELGTFITNFTLIKPGAFHRANGGYLILDVIQLLNKPFVWDLFKRTLLSEEIKLQPLEQQLSVSALSSLEPDSIPLDIKVILVGDRTTYYLLKRYDPDFGQLFKIQADCSEQLTRTPESCRLYSRLIKTLQSEANTRHLDRNAVARIIEYAARLVEDGEKLTLHRETLSGVLLEANYWAQQHNHNLITLQAVEQTIDARQYRAGYLKECVTDSIHRGIHQIETEGETIGQVNGLSVICLDDSTFGRPSRITAAVHLGPSNILDIEREVDLSGASHSKGVMILTAFLREQYEQQQPLAFSATLTFEQSYGMVDGDSASAAELCALLSAIAQIPLKQNIAVTGAIDQHGNIEAIGGVNEKVEGFFDICNAGGLTGEQGVIIPKTNAAHLMVNKQVRQSVESKQFHVWAVDHISQVMVLLTGLPMGEINSQKQFPAHSINGAVISRIKQMNKALNKTNGKTNGHARLKKTKD